MVLSKDNVLEVKRCMLTKLGKSSLRITALTCRSVTLKFSYLVVSLNKYDLILSVLVYMQEQQNYSQRAWHMGIEIVSNGSRKISFFPLFVKEKTVFLFFYIMFIILIFWPGRKNCIIKNDKWILFPKSQYVNLHPAV